MKKCKCSDITVKEIKCRPTRVALTLLLTRCATLGKIVKFKSFCDVQAPGPSESQEMMRSWTLGFWSLLGTYISICRIPLPG